MKSVETLHNYVIGNMVATQREYMASTPHVQPGLSIPPRTVVRLPFN